MKWPTLNDTFRWLRNIESDGTITIEKSRRGLYLALEGGPPAANQYYGTDSVGDPAWFDVTGIIPNGTADYQTLVWDNTTDQAWEVSNVFKINFDDSHVEIWDATDTYKMVGEVDASGNCYWSSVDGPLLINDDAGQDIYCFAGAEDGQVPEFRVYGYRSTKALEYLSIAAGIDNTNTASFGGSCQAYRFTDAGGDYFEMSPVSSRWRTNNTEVVFDSATGVMKFQIKGKSGNRGEVDVYGNNGSDYVILKYATFAELTTKGDGLDLHINSYVNSDILCFANAASGETPSLKVSGRNNTDTAARTFEMSVHDTVDDAFKMTGPNDLYLVDMNLLVTGTVNDDSEDAFCVENSDSDECFRVCNDQTVYVSGAYALPTAAPASDNYVMICTAAGVASWSALLGTLITAGNLIDIDGTDIDVDLTEAAGYNAANEQALVNDAGTIEWWDVIDIEDALALLPGFGASAALQTDAGSNIEWA